MQKLRIYAQMSDESYAQSAFRFSSKQTLLIEARLLSPKIFHQDA